MRTKLITWMLWLFYLTFSVAIVANAQDEESDQEAIIIDRRIEAPAKLPNGMPPVNISRGNPLAASPFSRTGLVLPRPSPDDDSSTSSEPEPSPEPEPSERRPRTTLEQARELFPEGLTDEQAVIAYARVKGQGIYHLVRGQNIFTSSHRLVARTMRRQRRIASSF